MLRVGMMQVAKFALIYCQLQSLFQKITQAVVAEWFKALDRKFNGNLFLCMFQCCLQRLHSWKKKKSQTFLSLQSHSCIGQQYYSYGTCSYIISTLSSPTPSWITKKRQIIWRTVEIIKKKLHADLKRWIYIYKKKINETYHVVSCCCR